MATVGQIYYNVVDSNSGSYISSPNIDIYKDIVNGYGAAQFTKLGVQAPPGTKMVMNETKSIMVGRTGIYELDNNIAISNLYFVRPYKYLKDEEASSKAKEAGIQGMMDADNKRREDLNQLKFDYPETPTDDNDPKYESYWDRYNTIQTQYIAEYQKALGDFTTGVNGIYVLPDPSNTDSTENYDELYDIIVDFIYE